VEREKAMLEARRRGPVRPMRTVAAVAAVPSDSSRLPYDWGGERLI